MAALAVLCLGGLLEIAHHELNRTKKTASVQSSEVNVANPQDYPTTLALTMLALTDNEKFETFLANESRSSLPSFQGKQSGLKVLAKE